ncbi:MAG: hypothetical protein RLY90_1094 [Pseudomonadota bacterium]
MNVGLLRATKIPIFVLDPTLESYWLIHDF